MWSGNWTNHQKHYELTGFKTLFLATSYNLALVNMKFGFNEGQVVECQCQCHLSLPKHTVQGWLYSYPSDLSRKKWCTLTMLMTVCIPHITISYFSSSAKQFICFKLYNEKSPSYNMVEKNLSVFHRFQIDFFPFFFSCFPHSHLLQVPILC